LYPHTIWIGEPCAVVCTGRTGTAGAAESVAAVVEVVVDVTGGRVVDGAVVGDPGAATTVGTVVAVSPFAGGVAGLTEVAGGSVVSAIFVALPARSTPPFGPVWSGLGGTHDAMRRTALKGRPSRATNRRGGNGFSIGKSSAAVTCGFGSRAKPVDAETEDLLVLIFGHRRA